jgi:hypothetical protein
MEDIMKTKILLSMAIILFLSCLAFAQDNSAITVEDIQICTSIQDRQPVGANTSFAKDVGQLYCFTKLSGSQDAATISHVWYHNDQEMRKVELNAQAKIWRTWSTKNILNTLTGEWRVDVVSSDGKVLTSKQFTITE